MSIVSSTTEGRLFRYQWNPGPTFQCQPEEITSVEDLQLWLADWRVPTNDPPLTEAGAAMAADFLVIDLLPATCGKNTFAKTFKAFYREFGMDDEAGAMKGNQFISMSFEKWAIGSEGRQNIRTNLRPPPSEGNAIYSITCLHMGLVWKWCEAKRTIKAVLRRTMVIPNECLELPLVRITSLNAMSPAIAMLDLYLIFEYDTLLNTIYLLGDVNKKLGFYKGARPTYAEVEDLRDLANLLQYSHVRAIDLIWHGHVIERSIGLADSIFEEANGKNPGDANIRTLALHLRRRAELSHARSLCVRQEASLVIQTIMALSSQADQRSSIQIAQNSNSLTEKATKDSSSMKAIAAVTMCFLPGTFVSSLFATPMFDWDSSKSQVVALHGIWLYWVVTIPITIAVVTFWLLWTETNLLRLTWGRIKAVVSRGTETSKADEKIEGIS